MVLTFALRVHLPLPPGPEGDEAWLGRSACLSLLS